MSHSAGSTPSFDRYHVAADGPGTTLTSILPASPVCVATMWLATAHAVAWGKLPSQVVESLGYPQPALLQCWETPPPESAIPRITALLTQAARVLEAFQVSAQLDILVSMY